MKYVLQRAARCKKIPDWTNGLFRRSHLPSFGSYRINSALMVEVGGDRYGH